MKTEKIVDDLKTDLIEFVLEHLSEKNNLYKLEHELVDPLIEYIIHKLKPFVILTISLFLIIIIMITLILYLMIS